MESVRRPTKKDILFNLFREVGDSYKLEEVYDVLGYSLEEKAQENNMVKLKNQCSYFRKSKHIPEENRIDLRIKWGTVTRVN